MIKKKSQQLRIQRNHPFVDKGHLRKTSQHHIS